jgi:hypothetical protein
MGNPIVADRLTRFFEASMVGRKIKLCFRQCPIIDMPLSGLE